MRILTLRRFVPAHFRSAAFSLPAAHSPAQIDRPEIQEKDLDVPVTDDDIDALYDALSAPVDASAALSADPAQLDAAGPAARAASKLSPNYLAIIKSNLDDPHARRSQAAAIASSTVDAALSKESKPSLATITQLIHINAIAGRTEQAVQAFEFIQKLGLVPDIVAFNHLMDAHARASDLVAATNVFAKIQASGTKPDLVSYSTLIKACVAANDLNAAFKLYTDMKSNGIMPNPIIFTTLIKGCIRSNDLDRAWKTFDFMRIEVGQPDDVVFNLMIHACSKSKDAERALDLFHDMSARNMPISSFTFNALIQACMSRPDYYHEAYNLLEQMAAISISPDMYTYCILLNGAARYGDVPRARIVWNDIVSRMMEQNAALNPSQNSSESLNNPVHESNSDQQTSNDQNSSSENLLNTSQGVIVNKIQPTDDVFGAMFRAYAHGIKNKIWKTIGKSTLSIPQDPSKSDSKNNDDLSNSDNHEPEFDSESKTCHDSSSSQNVPDLFQPILEMQDCGFPFLKSTDISITALIKEADALWDLWQTKSSQTTETESTSPKPPSINIRHRHERVYTDYLSVVCSDNRSGALNHAMPIWNTIGTKFGHSFDTLRSMLNLVTRRPETVDKIDEIFEAILKWDEDMEKEMIAKASFDVDSTKSVDRSNSDTDPNMTTMESTSENIKDQPTHPEPQESVSDANDHAAFVPETTELTTTACALSEREKELLRLRDRRSRHHIHNLFLITIRGHARHGNYTRAMQLVHATTTYRYPLYLPSIQFREIPILVTHAKTNADNGNWELMERLIALCPESKDPLSQIQHILKSKSIPVSSWWGWNVLGMDDHQLEIMRRQHYREKRQISQRMHAMRNRGHRPKESACGWEEINLALMGNDASQQNQVSTSNTSNKSDSLKSSKPSRTTKSKSSNKILVFEPTFKPDSI